jgi:hypothetical protein
MRRVGIEGEFGIGGHTAEQWPEFGSVQKTLAEFKAAYDKFRADTLALFAAAAGPAPKAAAPAPAVKAAPAIKKAAAKKPAVKKIAAAATKKAPKKAVKAAPAKRGKRR